MPKLQVVIGSTRPGRAADLVTGWALDRVGRHEGFETEVLDLRDWPLPVLRGDGRDDRRLRRSDLLRSHRRSWNRKVAEGDAYLFITPEYNHSVPGVLKNAIDSVFVSFALRNKPAAFIGYSGGNVGGARAVEHLAHIVIEAEMVPLRNTVLVGQVQGAFDGIEPTNPMTDIALAITLDDLAWWARVLKAARTEGELPPAWCARGRRWQLVNRVRPGHAAVDDGIVTAAMKGDTMIDGHVEPGFEGVRDAFARNFTEHGDVGAGFSLHVEGRKVVDLWGGVADPATGPALHRGHPAARVLDHQGRDRGLRQPPRPARRCSTSTRRSPRYWPEFAARRARRTSPSAGCSATRRACRRSTSHLSYEEVLAWEPLIRRPRGAGALLGAGDGARLPRRDLRLPRGRGRAPHHRQEPGHLLRRGGGRHRSASSSGSGCPTSTSTGWPR